MWYYLLSRFYSCYNRRLLYLHFKTWTITWWRRRSVNNTENTGCSLTLLQLQTVSCSAKLLELIASHLMTGRSSGLTGDVTLSQLRCLDCCLVKLVLCQWFVKVRFSSAAPRCKQNVRTVKTVSNGGKTRNNKQQHKPEQEPVRRYKNRFKRLFNGDNNQ